MNTLEEVVVRNATTGKLVLVTSKPTRITEANPGGILPDSDPIAVSNGKKLKIYIINNCADKVLHSINPAESSLQILDKLNSVYGFGNVDPLVIQQDISE